MDIVTAYLYSEIDKEIYIQVPEGSEDFIKNATGKVLQLQKGLYGLKQAGRLWNDNLSKSLLEIGYMQSIYDPGMYYKRRGSTGEIIIVLIYVDDIIVATKDEEARKELEEHLSARYKVICLGLARSMLRTLGVAAWT